MISPNLIFNIKGSFGARCICLPLLILFSLVFAQSLPGQDVHYHLRIDQELYKTVQVGIVVKNPAKPRLVVSMPIWVPGHYLVGNYGKNVVQLAATDLVGRPLRVEKLSHNDWEIQTLNVKDVRIDYQVLTSGINSWEKALDSSGALLEGATTWMYLRGFTARPIRLTIDQPDNWQIATALAFDAQSNAYRAENYDELVDSPILMGELRLSTFTHENHPHELYFRGEGDFDLAAFTAMVEKIVAYQCGLFRLIPYPRYVFLYTLVPGVYGYAGLEHRNSTTISISTLKLLQDIKSAANITAHEFFHLWNVERLTSDELLPLRYDRGPRTTSLWWLEGVTSYYADLTLVRTGIWSAEEFLQQQSQEIVRLLENSDRFETSLAQSSWDIWEHGYGTSRISYYNKGQLVGLVLDLTIRKITANEKSLDDVIRYLYRTFAMDARGFGDDDLQKAVETVTGKDFGAFFDRYVTGLVEIPFQELLRLAGWDTQIAKKPIPTIGPVRLLRPRNRIFSLDANSPASLAGIRKNDLIRSIDGEDFAGEEELAELFTTKQVGEVISVSAQRDGVSLSFSVKIGSIERITCEIHPSSSPTAEQLSIQQSLLKGEQVKP